MTAEDLPAAAAERDHPERLLERTTWGVLPLDHPCTAPAAAGLAGVVAVAGVGVGERGSTVAAAGE